MVDLRYAEHKTPSPSDNWMRLSDAERVLLVTQTLQNINPIKSWPESISVVSANIEGQEIFRYYNPMPANIRGRFLLDVEHYIKTEIDFALTVWLEPIEDRNSLRKLRGIEVKS